MSPFSSQTYKFGQFVVELEQKVLLNDGSKVPITEKTFEVLHVLIEGRERVMTRDELMSILWPHTEVEESNLDKHISKLRDAFGDRFPHKNRHIKTFPRYGYQFVAKLDDWPEREKIVPEPDPLKTIDVQADSRTETREYPRESDDFSEADNLNLNKEEIVIVNKKNVTTIRKIRWWLWLGIGLITAGLLGALFVGLRLFKKPEILSIIPATPFATIGDQSIVLTGHNFQEGSTVRVIFPSGGSGILEGKQIQPGTETSMVILADFSGNWGKYKLEVISPYGRTSAPFNFEALKHIQSPTIEAIIPESPEATKQAQSVVIYGHNFAPDVIVEVIFPDERSATLQRSQIPQRMPTAMTILINFDGRPGTYSFRVRNQNGYWCTPFSFIAH